MKFQSENAIEWQRLSMANFPRFDRSVLRLIFTNKGKRFDINIASLKKVDSNGFHWDIVGDDTIRGGGDYYAEIPTPKKELLERMYELSQVPD